MPNLRAPIPWLWEFLALKVEFVAGDAGNCVTLPLATSLACDSLTIERTGDTRG